MMLQLPLWITGLFLFTTVITLVLFFVSNNKPFKGLTYIIVWAIFQSILAFIGFYRVMDTFPPRFSLLLPPIVITLTYLLTGKRKELMVLNRNLKLSTFIHTVRIPVEIILLYLFAHKMVPQLMTYEGRNFDILAGITAPIIGWLYYKDRISDKALFLWNITCLALVCFIAINAILSAELPFQQFGFEQPNKALIYFPFILLPAVVVPLVIYQHIGDIIIIRRRLK